MKLFGALEAGGTKMVCAVGDETGRILERTSIPTQTPEQTMRAMIDFFKDKALPRWVSAASGRWIWTGSH